MSISDLTCDSIFLLGLRRYDSAMCLALNALDATAQFEYPELAGPNHVGDRCERFITDHLDVISIVGTAGAVFSVPGSGLNVIKGHSTDEMSLESVLYKLIRCSLTHEAALPSNTYFNEEPVLGKTEKGLSIPVTMIYAVILAVSGATSNVNGTLVPGTPDMIVMGRQIRLADCWGRKSAILATLGVSESSGLLSAGAVSAVGVNHGTMQNCTFGPNAIGVNKGTVSGKFDARLQSE